MTQQNYVLLTHTECWDEPDYCDEASLATAYYSYELVVPAILAEACEQALDYLTIYHEWTQEYNDCHYYRLGETEVDNNQWQKVTDKLSLAMAEFMIEYGHDLTCYRDY